MSTGQVDYVRGPEDSRSILNSLLYLSLQRRALKTDEVDAALSVALRKLVECTKAQFGAILQTEPKDKTFIVRAIHVSPRALLGDDRSRRALEVYLHRRKLNPGNSAEQRVVATQDPLVSGESVLETSVFSEVLHNHDLRMRSLILLPLYADKQAIGVLGLYNKQSFSDSITSFSHEDLHLTHDTAQICGQVLRRLHNPTVVVSDGERVASLARLARCPQTDVVTIDSELALNIGEETIRRYRILPMARMADGQLRVATDDPLNQQNITDFEIASGCKIGEKVVASEACLNRALDETYSSLSRVARVAKRLSESYDPDLELVAEEGISDDTNEHSMLIIKMASRMIEDAFQQGASDIHIEPAEDKLLVRYRIDGYCRVKLTLPKPVHRPLVARIKIMSDLDITEHRLPQDGKIVFKRFSPDFDLDLRVSVAPMNHGESVVMRILDKQRSTLPLNKLGFSEYNLVQYHKLLTMPYGMILHCGPTGSGKSMTLYAALNEINSPEIKILTAEDPIEYTLPGINQMQMKSEIGLTFASALRCFLRQDPDIILVGEIRDKETAEIAIESALTGHLLFSTLHTNDATSTITRLTDIGIEPFLISSTLIGICAQRLMRRLCVCKMAAEPTKEELLGLQCARDSAPVSKIYHPAGCEKCDNSGYKGRIGIHELLCVTDDVRQKLSLGAAESDVKRIARQQGMRTLFEDSMEKVKAGVTSMQEALATAKADEDTAAELHTRGAQ